MKRPLEYLESFVVFVLVLTGLTGIAYNLLREDGWLESVTRGIWRLTMRSPLMVSAVIAGAVVFGLIWRRRRKFERQQGRAATFVFYIMISAGAYYLGHLAIRGTL